MSSIDIKSIDLKASNGFIDFKYFSSIESLWEICLDKEAPYSPYSTYEWYKLWISHFINNDTAKIFAYYDINNINFIVPLIYSKPKYRGINISKYEPIGNVYSPIRNIVIFNNCSFVDNIDMVFGSIVRDYNKWDIFDICEISNEENWLPSVSEYFTRRGFSIREYDCYDNCYSDCIKGTSEDYFNSRSKSFRLSIRKNYNRLSKAGDIRFRVITGEADCPDYYEIYSSIYSKSWKKKERVGREFFPRMLRYAEKNQWLRIGIVYLNERPIATVFVIVAGKHAYFEKVAFDEEFRNFGAGSVCLYEMIKHVIDVDKVSVIDFLRGADEYKRHWVAKCRKRVGLMVYNNTIRGRYLSVVDRKILPIINRNPLFAKFKKVVFSFYNNVHNDA